MKKWRKQDLSYVVKRMAQLAFEDARRKYEQDLAAFLKKVGKEREA